MTESRLYRWELYFRYRRDYEHGGPWVYIGGLASTVFAEREELESALKQRLHDSAEIISLRRLYEEYKGLTLTDTRVVRAKDAREAAARP